MSSSSWAPLFLKRRTQLPTCSRRCENTVLITYFKNVDQQSRHHQVPDQGSPCTLPSPASPGCLVAKAQSSPFPSFASEVEFPHAQCGAKNFARTYLRGFPSPNEAKQAPATPVRPSEKKKTDSSKGKMPAAIRQIKAAEEATAAASTPSARLQDAEAEAPGADEPTSPLRGKKLASGFLAITDETNPTPAFKVDLATKSKPGRNGAASKGESRNNVVAVCFFCTWIRRGSLRRALQCQRGDRDSIKVRVLHHAG